MLSQRTANLVFVVIILLACGYFAWTAEGFLTSGLLASSGLPSKFFPQLVLGLIALCAVVVGYLYVVRGGAGGDDDETVFEDGREARQGFLILVVAVCCHLIWRSFGFVPMALLMGPFCLLAMRVRRPIFYAVLLAINTVVTAAFSYGLGIHLW